MAEGGHICDSRGEVLNMTFEKHCGCSKLATYDWMKDIPKPEIVNDTDVLIRIKMLVFAARIFTIILRAESALRW